MRVELRRSEPLDVDFLLELLADEEIRPFLGPRTAATRDAVLEEIERSLAEPESFGRFVVEADGERAGMLGFHVANERSRIARLERLAIHPRFRGRRLADEAARLCQRLLLEELGFHRLELEIYAFNDRACAHAERAASSARDASGGRTATRANGSTPSSMRSSRRTSPSRPYVRIPA